MLHVSPQNLWSEHSKGTKHQTKFIPENGGTLLGLRNNISKIKITLLCHHIQSQSLYYWVVFHPL